MAEARVDHDMDQASFVAWAALNSNPYLRRPIEIETLNPRLRRATRRRRKELDAARPRPRVTPSREMFGGALIAERTVSAAAQRVRQSRLTPAVLAARTALGDGDGAGD